MVANGDFEEGPIMVRRTKAELAYSILEIARKGIGKAELLKASGLPKKSAERHISLMIKKGLLIEKQEYYTISEKGKQFMSEFRKYRELEMEYMQKLREVRKLLPELNEVERVR